jgi:methyl-accepting chemotaxis protein
MNSTAAATRGSEDLVFGELDAAHRDLRQVQSIISDAVKQLATGFEEIASQSASQQGLLSGTLDQIGDASPANASVAGFISQTDALLGRAAEGLNQATQRTLELTQSLAGVDSAFRNLVTHADSVRDVSEQVRVLAFNAKLEAARAGDAGIGFSVVAETVQALSNDFRQLTERIRDTVERARQTLTDSVQVAQGATEADRRLVHATRTEMGAMQVKTARMRDTMAASLLEATRMNEAVHVGVNQCLKGLQFGDLVERLCQVAQTRRQSVALPAGTTTATDVAATGAASTPLQVARDLSLQQTSLDAGEIEFF